MTTRENYDAMTFIDKLTSMRYAGYSEKEIAEMVGNELGEGKLSVSDLRDLIKEKKDEIRSQKAKEISDLVKEGYSLKEAGEKVGITSYSQARSLALWHYLNKGENNE